VFLSANIAPSWTPHQYLPRPPLISPLSSPLLTTSRHRTGIGLSNTLGAFLAGLLLAETKYKYQIEADIAPFRGLLLGFFFITVGFNIDLGERRGEERRATSQSSLEYCSSFYDIL
jgi:Sodium/hydrogen exchanger family